MSGPPRGLPYRHPRVQRLRRLLGRRSVREDEGRFVIEGVNLLEEALQAGSPVEAVFLASGWDRSVEGRPGAPAASSSTGRLTGLVERCYSAGIRVFELGPGVLERVAGTVSPQPVLAVVEVPAHSLEALGATAPQLLVVCIAVRDPGNAGTLARASWAAGADAVVACEGTVDFWNPKAVRSSAGAVLHLPVVPAEDPATALDEIGAWGLDRWGAVAEGGSDYATFDFSKPCAFVVGNESAGLPLTELLEHLDGLVTVPMPGGAESLNVGIATAVLCFEAVRQRRSDLRAGQIPHGRAHLAGKLASQ